MVTRERLPNRRSNEQIEFWHEGLRCLASIGRYPDGRIGEIFLRAGEKPDSGSDVSARDMTIAASIGLQYGMDIETLRKALTRNARDEPLSPLGTLLDMLASESTEEVELAQAQSL